MHLLFTKEGNKWVAEFEAPSDFNLHIERENVAYINIMQRVTSNGAYDLAKNFSSNEIFDYDFGALVYPKYIKVISGSEVVSASVNFNEGGGSGNGSGEISTVEYLDVSGINQEPYFTMLLITSFVSKNKENGVVAISPSAAMVGYNNSLIISLAIDFSFKTSNGTVLELLLNMGITQEQLDAIPRLTKEQFYNLEA